MKLRPPKVKSPWPKAFRRLHEADVSDDPDLAELYKEMKADMKPMTSDFHDGLNERAGIESDEQEEIMQLIERRRRLKNRS